MSLRELSLSTVFVVPRDDIAGQLLIPSMECARDVRIMAGFFNSGCFTQLAAGLAAFINKSDGPLTLLVSPRIEPRDRKAIERAVADPEGILKEVVIRLFKDGVVSESALARHTVDCLSYLLAAERLVLRFVLMQKGMFHPKVWIFSDGESTIVAHGSSNPTEPGLLYNWEVVSVEKSWVEKERTEIFGELFKDVWEGTDPTSLTISLPEGLRFIRNVANGKCPTTEDFWRAWQEDVKKGHVPALSDTVELTGHRSISSRLNIPEGISWQDGPFAHQGGAVDAWEKSNRRGILSIATGGGKTIASLIAATRLQDEVTPLLIVISAPFKPLLQQWRDEVSRFGVDVVPIEGASPGRRESLLQQAVMSLELGQSDVEVIVISHGMLNQDDFRAFLDEVPRTINTLLIADEVHHLGALGFTGNRPESFRYRLGLSATPIRQYDDEGTDALLDYFGDIVFDFDLGQAIRAGCLIRYNYYLHPVGLTEAELEEWEELSARLRRMGFLTDRDTSGDHLSEKVKLLLFRRRATIENAESKTGVLRELFRQQDCRAIRHTLIYTSAKNRTERPKQIVCVNRILNELGIIAHELTFVETGSGTAQDILESFASGSYQVLTCMKVLDEGLDVPQTKTAYLLASSTVLREWVQRRGRILRKAQGKTIAHLHDFLVVPPDPQSPSGRAILRQELDRGREFASLAENSGASGGPWEVMSEFQPLVR